MIPFRFIFRTSFNHIRRMPWTSAGMVFVISILILILIVGVSLLRALAGERAMLEERFTYPLALNPIFSFENIRVRNFAESLTAAGLSSPLVYINRESALDAEIKKNPEILSILSGENPFPDMIIIPLKGMDTDKLWTQVRSFQYLFDSDVSLGKLYARLTRFENALQEIETIWMALLLFSALTGLLVIIMLFAILRYHFQFFRDERMVAKLVGADPIFIWGPHISTIGCYMVLGGATAGGLFFWLQHFL